MKDFFSGFSQSVGRTKPRTNTFMKIEHVIVSSKTATYTFIRSFVFIPFESTLQYLLGFPILPRWQVSCRFVRFKLKPINTLISPSAVCPSGLVLIFPTPCCMLTRVSRLLYARKAGHLNPLQLLKSSMSKPIRHCARGSSC